MARKPRSTKGKCESVNNFNWTPGIGDPTPGGWITVGLYFITAVAAWRTSITARPFCLDSIIEPRVWRMIAMLFIALGINKQLDLQTALTEAGRWIAREQGWYQERRIVQEVFVIALAILTLAACIVMLYLISRCSAQLWLAAVGVVFVMGFVLVRAASFHHVDEFLGSSVGSFRWNWILEIGGIVTVLIASIWRRSPLSSSFR